MQCSVMLRLTHVEQKWGSWLPPQETPITITEKYKMAKVILFSFWAEVGMVSSSCILSGTVHA